VWDEKKVPLSFPKMKAHSWVFSEVPAKPQRPYYDARKVWKWFKAYFEAKKGVCDYCWETLDSVEGKINDA